MKKIIILGILCMLILGTLAVLPGGSRAATAITTNKFIENVTKTIDCRNYRVEPDSYVTDITVSSTSIEIYSDQNTAEAEVIHIYGVEIRPGTLEFEWYRHSDDTYDSAWSGYIAIGAIPGCGYPFFEMQAYYSSGWAILDSSGDVAWSATLKNGDTWKFKFVIYDNYTYDLYINDTLVLQYHSGLSSSILKPTAQELIIRLPSKANDTNIFHYSISNITQTYTRNLITPVMPSKYIAYIMDDATLTEWNFTQKLHESGYTATIGVVTSYIDTTGYWTLSQLKTAHGWGFELADHTVHHYKLTSQTWSTVQTEIRDAKIWLESNVGVKVTTFIPPGGATNTTIDEYAFNDLALYDAYLSYRRVLADNTSADYSSTYNEYMNLLIRATLIRASDCAFVVYNHGDRDLSETNLENFINTAKKYGWTIGTYRNFFKAAWGLMHFNASDIEFTKDYYKFKANSNGYVDVYDYYNLKSKGTVIVKDLTTGTKIKWYPGSFRFYVTEGHVYKITVDYVSTTVTICFDLFLAIVPLLVVIMIFGMIGQIMQEVAKSAKNFRRK